MHELSIAEEIVRVIREELRALPNVRLKAARVRVGTLRLIEPVTLEHCFEAATWDGPLAGARLCVERVNPSARCRKCEMEFTVEHHWFECPRCGTIGAELLCGDELQLVGLEIEPAVEGVYANQA